MGFQKPARVALADLDFFPGEDRSAFKSSCPQHVRPWANLIVRSFLRKARS